MQSFQLERKSGKKCYMLAARSLFIVWGDTTVYWNWIPMPESRLAFYFSISLIQLCFLFLC